MTTAAIREKLANYLKIADDKKIKALYTIVEDDINTNANDWDDDFVAALEKRSKEFSDGKIKSYSWEETKAVALRKTKLK